MWYPAKITVAAAAEPVTLTEAKLQCRVDFADDDDLLKRLISVARDHVEHYCGVRLASRTVEVACDCFADFARLPEAPASSVTKVTYVDTAGVTQTLDASVYEFRPDGLEPSIALKYGQRWPAIQPGSRITVTAVVGYGDAPEAVKHAMLMLIGAWYEKRQALVIAVRDFGGIDVGRPVDRHIDHAADRRERRAGAVEINFEDHLLVLLCHCLCHCRFSMRKRAASRQPRGVSVERQVRSIEVTVSGTGVWAQSSNGKLLDWFYSSATKTVQLRNTKAATADTAIESGPALLTTLNNSRTKGQKVSAEIELQFDGVPARSVAA